MHSFNQIQVALIQIEQSVKLALDEKDYISSITLAGAADEILGSMLKTLDNTPAYDQLRNVMDAFHKTTKTESLGKKEFNELANGVRNRLKHNCEYIHVDFDPAQEACNMLHRAISNFESLTGYSTPIMARWHSERELPPKYTIAGNI